jgi:hypothetical protein
VHHHFLEDLDIAMSINVMSRLMNDFLDEVSLWLLNFCFIWNSKQSEETITNSSVLHFARSSLGRRHLKATVLCVKKCNLCCKCSENGSVVSFASSHPS